MTEQDMQIQSLRRICTDLEKQHMLDTAEISVLRRKMELMRGDLCALCRAIFEDSPVSSKSCGTCKWRP